MCNLHSCSWVTFETLLSDTRLSHFAGVHVELKVQWTVVEIGSPRNPIHADSSPQDIFQQPNREK